jgi:hypothetical protein
MFAGDLIDEYVLLARQGLTFEDLWELNRRTLDATFLGPEEKALLRTEWDAFGAALAH